MTKVLHLTLVTACLSTLLLILVQHAGVALANYEHTCDYNSRPHPRGMCGSQLADVIGLICQRFLRMMSTRRYNGPIKREVERSTNENLRGILLNRKDALSYLTKRGTSGSVLCECCYNPCTPQELVQYCDLPNGYKRGT